MGVEIITQPQFFVSPLTAYGGIQGFIENYPLITTYNSWTTASETEETVFPIPGIFPMMDASESFIVNVGGVLQPPQVYSINPSLRTITFTSPVSANVEIAVTQLATAAPSSVEYDFIKARSGIFSTLSTTDITVLSSVFSVTTIVNTWVEENSATFYDVVSTVAGGKPFWDFGYLAGTHYQSTSGNFRAFQLQTQALSSNWNYAYNAATAYNAVSSQYVTNVSGNARYLTLSGGTITSNTTTPALRITQTGTGNALLVEDEATDTTPFVIDQNGNVGINTPTPTDRLQINTQDGLRFGVTGNTSYVRIGSASTGEATSEISFTRSSGNINISQGNTGSTLTNRVTINNIGDVGIGTVSPTTKLTIFGSGSSDNNPSTSLNLGATLLVRDSNSSTGSGGMILFGANQGSFSAIKGFITNGANNTRGHLIFATRTTNTDTNLTECLRITDSGNVGIGTTTTGNTRLCVQASGDYTPALTVQSNAAAANWARMDFLNQNISTTPVILAQAPAGNFFIRTEGAHPIDFATNGIATGGATVMRINANGNVGIGTISPNEKLTVSGNLSVSGLIYGTAQTIADGIVTEAKIATNAVTNTKIANSAVTNDKLSLTANASQIKNALNANNNPPIYACRAWVSFDGTRNVTNTGASTNGQPVFIRGSGNVTSVVKNALGDFTINFTTAMPDTNYCMQGSAQGISGTSTIYVHNLNTGTIATNSIRIVTGNQGLILFFDSPFTWVTFFR